MVCVRMEELVYLPILANVRSDTKGTIVKKVSLVH